LWKEARHLPGGPFMDIQYKVKLTRLQCEYLRTLLDQGINELTTLEHALAMAAHPCAALVETSLHGVAEQSGHIAGEAARLQRFLHARVPLSPAAGESPPSSPPPAATAERGSDTIEGRPNGKEPDGILYERYADPENRTFPNDRYPIPVDDYLSGREKGMH